MSISSISRKKKNNVIFCLQQEDEYFLPAIVSVCNECPFYVYLPNCHALWEPTDCHGGEYLLRSVAFAELSDSVM